MEVAIELVMNSFKAYCRCLWDRDLRTTAFKVAIIVGSILFTINHGRAFVKGQMTDDRWLSAGLTYVVPYLVNIHGQFISRYRQQTGEFRQRRGSND